jgi:RimJ/RimL family protein N-acetyltransferase
MKFPVEARLKDGTPIHLLLAGEQDLEPLSDLYRIIVTEGSSYPHDQFPARDEFMDYWYRGKTTVVAYPRSHAVGSELLGAFYLKPNWPGRARHVANAGFIVAPAWRNRGLGWLLGASMLQHAKDLGYRGVIFNLVFAENRIARYLWTKLGFEELGAVRGAVRNNDGSYQDAMIMFRSLLDK